MTECCIGIGECSRFYIYIFFSIIFNLTKDFSLKKAEKLNDCLLILSIYKYFGFAIFGALLYYISLKRNKSQKKNKVNIKNQDNSSSKLIYAGKKSITIEDKDKNMFLIISLFYIIFLESIQILCFFDFRELFIWSFDSFSMVIIMNFFYPKKMYRHQLCSMIFIIIFCSTLLIIASIIKREEYNKEENIYENRGIVKCLLLMVYFIFITSLNSFDRIKIKPVMDYKFISPYKILFFIGIFGFVLNIIALIIFVIIDGKCENQNIFCYGDISKYFSEIKKSDLDIIFIEIISSFFYIFFYALSLACEFLIIKNLDSFFVLIADIIYFEIERIIGYEEAKKDLIKFIIIQVAEIIALMSCLIYLEVIELRFCGLNHNLRKNISLRGINDTNEIMSNLNNIKITNDEDSDDEDNNNTKDKEETQIELS